MHADKEVVVNVHNVLDIVQCTIILVDNAKELLQS